jgi:dCMP deaminase
MSRITRECLYLNIAQLMSLRGTCQRAKVGCVIAKNNRIIATGYNGPLPSPGLECEGNCNIDNPCSKAIHAEANAIAFSARVGISLEGSVLYCTHGPCLKCAEMIIQAGIKEVYYITPFRDSAGVQLLITNAVAVMGRPTTFVELSDFEKIELHGLS